MSTPDVELDARLSFTMPSLGADMDAGTILEWRVHPGDTVHRGDIIAVVQTDKSDLDVEVFHDGVIAELLVDEGVKVAVGTPLAVLTPLGTAAPAAPAAPPRVAVTPAAAATPASGAAPVAPVASTATAGRLTSPVLRHLAAEMHLDTSHLVGTGPGGRVTRDDLDHAGADAHRTATSTAVRDRRRMTPRARRLAREHDIDPTAFDGQQTITGDIVLAHAVTRPPSTAPAGPAPVSPAPVSPAPAGPAPASPTAAGGDTMRRTIARLMSTAWREIPHYQVSSRIDVGDAIDRLAARNADRPAAERTLTAALFLHAAARAAAAVPAVNGHWVDEAFVPAAEVHIAVVVSLRTGGLLAPVIRNADRKSIDEVMTELRDLVGRARAGRLRASEVGGATFTVTDLGEGGVETVVPIIHPPQVAILGLGAVHDEACVHDGAIAIRPVLHATLAGDHRAIDGRLGSLYLTSFTRFLAGDVDRPEQQVGQ